MHEFTNSVVNPGSTVILSVYKNDTQIATVYIRKDGYSFTSDDGIISNTPSNRYIYILIAIVQRLVWRVEPSIDHWMVT